MNKIHPEFQLVLESAANALEIKLEAAWTADASLPWKKKAEEAKMWLEEELEELWAKEVSLANAKAKGLTSIPLRAAATQARKRWTRAAKAVEVWTQAALAAETKATEVWAQVCSGRADQ